jgi:hypothetical protein
MLDGRLRRKFGRENVFMDVRSLRPGQDFIDGIIETVRSCDVLISVIGSYLDQRFWPQIHRRADEMPQPAFAPYAHLGDSLATELAETDASEWLENAMALETGVDDTHPSLADRLKALGEVPRISPPAAGQAADKLLGESLERLTSAFDHRWHDTILPSWEQRHQEVQQGRSRLAELDAQIDTQEVLSLQDAYERANLTETYGAGVDAAFEQFKQLHSRESKRK